MEKKITKREHFNSLLQIADVKANAELVAFIQNEIALLDKKNATRKSELTDTQKENQEYIAKIKAKLADGQAYTVSALAKEYGLSTQRVSPMMTKLLNAGEVSCEVVKRVKYYKVA